MEFKFMCVKMSWVYANLSRLSVQFVKVFAKAITGILRKPSDKDLLASNVMGIKKLGMAGKHEMKLGMTIEEVVRIIYAKPRGCT